ncbi:MAG: hypothetical protein ACTH3S_15845, partial [Marinobacter sp.]|uniref:hypothetical protein n=1 Tax=Marinobacter sp. TaxID=50741 RepID=UPI003F9DDF9D
NSYYALRVATNWPWHGNNNVTAANKDRSEWEYNKVTSATKVERPNSKTGYIAVLGGDAL